MTDPATGNAQRGSPAKALVTMDEPWASSINILQGAVAGAAVQARVIHGGVHLHGPHAVPPRQLPRGPARLVDRQSARALLAASRPGDTVLITGPGGRGKTALAIHTLHQLAARYPGGQLYADLRGYSRDPAAPGPVLEQWLRALGVPAHAVPADLIEQAALLRTHTTGRGIAVLLDNARSDRQICPLLPGAECLVIITTRTPIPALLADGARHIPLDPLEIHACVELLETLIGPYRTRTQPAPARALAAACDGSPLAVCIAGATLATHPNWPITALTNESKDGASPMTDTHIHDAAYRALDSDTARRMYRLLSVHDGPDITAEPAAAITGTTVAEVTALLAALAQAHLLTDLEGRYRFHDVTGAHARTLAEQIENERDLKDAFLRGMFWWRAKAASAAMLLNPERWYHWDGFTRTPRLFPDRDTALEWLETERFNLLATVRAAHRHRLYAVVCQFAEAMWMLFSLGHHYSIWEATYQLALNAAEAAGDLEQQARAWEGLAAFYLTQKRFTEARDVATHALELERLTGHTKGEGTALEQRSTALRCLGELDAAAADLHASMQLYHDQGHQRGVEIMRRHLGELALTAGDYPTAIDHLNTAEQWFATADPEEPYLQSRAAYALGQACHLSGDHDQAYAALERALTFARRARADQQEAHVLVALAELIGDDAAEPARQHLRRAYELYKTKGAPEAEVIGERIGR